ncbi:hypothetical protein [Clostridium tagluense]|uniref:hypothetical protein n=1 Tax=Clostridium tagluense TaxID=360422 RepID=UPI001C6F222B|nr:hypothetical protein [Clostridium tagluense]MBW9158038.1 hypothetical protein [Clostridium tagluense]WLC66466.1 hypothetical protein KTC93_04415 [Clostridium tagluense]
MILEVKAIDSITKNQIGVVFLKINNDDDYKLIKYINIKADNSGELGCQFTELGFHVYYSCSESIGDTLTLEINNERSYCKQK